MSGNGHFTLASILEVVLLSMAMLFGLGFLEQAYAASSVIDNSCTELNKYGFTLGLVYCIQSSIGLAVNQYVAVMQEKLFPYQVAAMTVAVAFFGLKLMNSHVQNPKKESTTLVCRIIIGVFFYYQAATMYNVLAGTPPQYDGVLNQAIGWITGFANAGSAGSGNNIFANLVSANCSKVSPPQDYEGFQIWQGFDCIFAKVFGAANPTTHPYAFFTSLLVIIGAALMSATLGVITAGLGISLFLGILLFICRALYLVLTAYLCIGFASIFMPLMAPLIYFESKFLTQKFKQLLGVILSCMFQTVFVVGFLGLAVSVDDMLIEGDLPGCTPPTPVGTQLSSAPPAGYGQDGKGVCSFTQLVCPGKKDADLETCFKNLMEQNNTAFEMTIGGTPQALRRPGMVVYDRINDPQTGLNVSKTSVMNQAHPFQTNNANLGLTSITNLKKIFPMKQLLPTILTFIFFNYAIKGLMEVVTNMAANMTIATGINLMQQMQLPLEGAVRDFLAGANDAMMSAAKGKGLLSGNLGGVGGMFKAIRGGFAGGAANMVSKR